MDDLWQQFHRLPKAIRDAVARPQALAAVDSLEQRYPNLDLASFVMRVAVQEFPIGDVPARLQQEFALSEADATAVDNELRSTVFSGVQEYLGISAKPKTPIPVPPPATTPPPPPVNLPVAEPKPVPPPPSPKPLAPPPAPVTTAKVQPVRPMTPPITPATPTGPVAPTQAYSDDDAAEIAQQARKLQTMAAPSVASLDDIAQEIIAQHHLAFHDELLAKRAVAILKARLKDIRNQDETLMMLVRGPKVGGLGLDEEIAKGVSNSLEQRVGVVKERGLVRPPEPIAPPPPPAMPPLAAKAPDPMPPLYRNSASASARPMMPPLPTAVPPAPPLKPVVPPPAIKRPADIPPPPTISSDKTATAQPVKTPPAPSVVKRARMIERPAIADITRPTKMLGPAEEMRTMTLTEFRRLGQGANESTKRLLEKFHDLQRESFTLWADALQGWRQSEVYQLYLAMGRQSMEQGMAISEVIKQRTTANQLYLSEHEFTALADLNRQLQT